MKNLPKFYNSLKEIEKEIYLSLSKGVKERESNFHKAVLATTNLENKPEARTVVLRNFEKKKLALSIHSDHRANKVVELNNNNNVSLLFYDEEKKIQLRIRGWTQVLKSEKKSWNKLSNWSKRCYLTDISPGVRSNKPTSGFAKKHSLNPPNENEASAGLENFCSIIVWANQIEWLYLASQGHRRAIFNILRNVYNESYKVKKIDAKWLVP